MRRERRDGDGRAARLAAPPHLGPPGADGWEEEGEGAPRVPRPQQRRGSPVNVPRFGALALLLGGPRRAGGLGDAAGARGRPGGDDGPIRADGPRRRRRRFGPGGAASGVDVADRVS